MTNPRLSLYWNFISSENRVCLGRLRWEKGTPGIKGGGHSNKLSVSLVFEKRDAWVGLYWTKPAEQERFWYICLIPFFPIRIHLMRAYGGIFP